ncbi:MAG: hypothetical protein AB8U44_03030 [Aaplasma endosymbiont of Hyalomma asiaticum]
MHYCVSFKIRIAHYGINALYLDMAFFDEEDISNMYDGRLLDKSTKFYLNFTLSQGV